MKLLHGLFCFCILLSMQAPAAEPIDLLVPAYANPCCGHGPEMWRRLIDTAQRRDRNFQLMVILNPASGPGKTRDANYINDAGLGPLKRLSDAGATIFGYVATGYGQRDEREIHRDIDGYLRDTKLYQGFVKGIFFDELSSDLAMVPRHQALVKYAKAIHRNTLTIANPGTTGTQNPSSQSTYSSTDYASVFDMLLTYEHRGDVYVTEYRSPIFKGSSRTAHMLHSQKEWDRAWLERMRMRGASAVFVTDKQFKGNATVNPYDRLPKYWEAIVSDLIKANER